MEEYREVTLDDLILKVNDIAEVLQVTLAKKIDMLDELIKFYRESLEAFVNHINAKKSEFEAKYQILIDEMEEAQKTNQKNFEKIMQMELETIKALQKAIKEQKDAYELYVSKMDEANQLIKNYNERAIEFNNKVDEFNEKARKYNKVLGVS